MEAKDLLKLPWICKYHTKGEFISTIELKNILQKEIMEISKCTNIPLDEVKEMIQNQNQDFFTAQMLNTLEIESCKSFLKGKVIEKIKFPDLNDIDQIINSWEYCLAIYNKLSEEDKITFKKKIEI